MNFKQFASDVSEKTCFAFERAKDRTIDFSMDAKHSIGMAWLETKHMSRCAGRKVVNGAIKAGHAVTVSAQFVALVVVEATLFAVRLVWWLIMLPINLVFAIFFAIYAAYVMGRMNQAFQTSDAHDSRFANATVVN